MALLRQETIGSAGSGGGGVSTKQSAEFFAATDTEVSFAPSTLNDKDRTVDVVWYGGMTVPRFDPDSGEPYMLRLNMDGCRLARLNAGAPLFDCHLNGNDWKSFEAGQVGSAAQRGHVVKAWADGGKGMGTLQFGVEGENEDTDRLWSGVASGRVRNLSFGTWIYKRVPVTDAEGNGMTMPHPSGSQAQVYEATDWEPFEVSVETIPADFTTEFLSASGERANSPKKEKPVDQVTQPGADARNNEQVLAAARDEATRMERERVASITTLGTNFKMEKLAGALVVVGASVADANVRFAAASEIRTIGKQMERFGITETFVFGLIDSGISVADARTKIQEEMVAASNRTTDGRPASEIRGDVTITRDGNETKLACMQEALVLRCNSNFYAQKTPSGTYFVGGGAEVQRRAEEMAREYVGLSLLEMARESLQLRGVNTRGMSKSEVASEALLGSGSRMRVYTFGGGAESTSDFPSILANVANKTLRQGYEAYPQTFKPFSRQVTAADFKPVNRATLSDAPSLQKLNEKGEYHRATLSDGNTAYSLGTFGEVVSLTRKTIINDDLQAFTRIPALLGVAAARTQSDIVWAIVTANPAAIYPGDTVSTALFATGHGNLLTGANSALALGATPPVTGIAAGRLQLRTQKAPQGTPLNLIPRYILLPAALETTGLQLIYPIQLAANQVTGVVPEWIQSLVPIIEPRLDVASTTAWYMVADPTQIDTIEYCFLEGQAGVYFETRQGFEVDGVEMKARMDFAAAAIDYRGLQKNAGA